MAVRVHAYKLLQFAVPAEPGHLYGISLRVVSFTDTGRYPFSHSAKGTGASFPSLLVGTGVRSQPLRGTPQTPVPVQYLPHSACRLLYTIKNLSLQLLLPRGRYYYTCALLYTRDTYRLPHGRHMCYCTRTPRNDRSEHARAPYTWARPPTYTPCRPPDHQLMRASVVMLQYPRALATRGHTRPRVHRIRPSDS